MTRDELVEKMARAIREAPIRATIKGESIIDGSLPMTPADLLRGTAALAAIEAAGCVVMPREALEKALEALLKSEPILYGRYDRRGYWDRHQETEQAVRSALGQTP